MLVPSGSDPAFKAESSPQLGFIRASTTLQGTVTSLSARGPDDSTLVANLMSSPREHQESRGPLDSEVITLDRATLSLAAGSQPMHLSNYLILDACAPSPSGLLLAGLVRPSAAASTSSTRSVLVAPHMPSHGEFVFLPSALARLAHC